jgi:ketosteroid isomerase-like protein
MIRRLSRIAYGTIAAVLLCGIACTRTPAASEADLIAVVESFYSAMKTGDTAAAMRLIAPDAVFLESGGLETRSQYEANHLPADIEFEKAVAGKRGPWRVTIEDDAAWMHALTEYQGTFKDAAVNFVSAQLVVLARDAGDWQIRTIHWSSKRR